MARVTITTASLAIDDLLAVVDGAAVQLSPDARDRIARSRALVDEALTSGAAVYGLTTQVGHGKDTRLSEDEIRGEQLFLVRSHSGGLGPPLPTAVASKPMQRRNSVVTRRFR